MDVPLTHSDLVDFMLQFLKTKCGIHVDAVIARAQASASSESEARVIAINELLYARHFTYSAGGDGGGASGAVLGEVIYEFSYMASLYLVPLSPMLYYENDPLIGFAGRFNFQNIPHAAYHPEVMGSLMGELVAKSKGEQTGYVSSEDTVTRRQFAAFCYMLSTMSLPKDQSGKYPGGVSGNQEVDNRIAAMLDACIREGMTNTQKVKAIYDFLIQNFEHNSDDFSELFGNYEGSINPLQSTVAIALLLLDDGTGVCDTFANTFRLLALRLGFECNYVSGYYINTDGSKSGHGWNQIKVDDEWYWIDVDAEGTVFKASGAKVPSYFLFMKKDADWVRHHAWDQGDWPACNGTKHPTEQYAFDETKMEPGEKTVQPVPVTQPVRIAMPKAGDFCNTALEEGRFVIHEDGSLWGYGISIYVEVTEQMSKAHGMELGSFVKSYGNKKIMDDVRSVAGSYFYRSLIVLQNDGSVWAWGFSENSVGNDFADMDLKKVMDGAVAVAAGATTAYIIKSDGSLWGFGNNDSGQLGNGKRNMYWTQTMYETQDFSGLPEDEPYYHTPIKIMDDVVHVSTSGYNTLAIKSDGSLWSWGENSSGQIGDGTKSEYYSVGTSMGIEVALYIEQDNERPTPVKIMDDVVYACSGANDMAIKSDGSLWMWGSNAVGQFGDGTITTYEYYYDEKGNYTSRITDNHDSYIPKKVMDGVKHVATGTYPLVAVIRTDNSLWLWGGNGYSPSYTTPVKVMDHAYSAVSYADILTADGTLHSTPKGWIDDPKLSLNGTHTEQSRENVKLPGMLTVTPVYTATPAASKVLVNGRDTAFHAYVIQENNYFKLRDLAYILSGTEKQFEVEWIQETGAIALTSKRAYTAVGGEMTGKGVGPQAAVRTGVRITLDGREIELTAYLIEENNYFKLRDLGAAFDFGVDWDGANYTVVIDTSKGYTAE